MSPARLARFLAVTAFAAVVLVVLGRAVLPRWYGPEAFPAALWAALVAFFGSLVGIVPLLSSGDAEAMSGPAGASRFLAAMILRLVAVGLGGAAVALVTGVALEPFLIWLGASYLVLLVVDTAFALKAFQRL